MYQFWGKSKKQDTDENNFHLLVYHCLDVAAVGKQFLEKDNSFKIKISKLSGLDPDIFESYFLFFLALHDIGKFSIRFQNRRPDILWKLKQIKSNADNHPRHDILGFHLWDRLLASCVIKQKLLPIGDGDELDWRDLFDPWARAVLGHHGKPPQADNLPLEFYFDENSQAKVLEFTKRLSELFFSAQNSKAFLEIEPYEEKLQAFNRLSWLLAGLSVLCDWIGSDERYFQFIKTPMPIEKYWHNHALLEAEKATADCGILIPPASKNSDFSFLFPHIQGQPSSLQEYTGAFDTKVKPQLHIFEDVTGSGKTEAALIAAHRMLVEGLGEGIFIALPTMATANSMYERVKNTYERLFEKNSRPSLILAHSARHLSESFRNSIGLENIESPSNDTEFSSAWCSLWLADNKKKSLLAAVGVGTIDQALLSILPSRHQSLRLLGLGRNILIVDEVHAYDPYMHSLLCRLLKFQAAQGGSTILLSATLPRQTKSDLVNAYYETLNNGEVLKENHYPLATLAYRGEINELPITHVPGTEKEVEVQLLHNIDEIKSVIVNAALKGACACWVRNTVIDAIEAYNILRESIDKNNLTIFHARFALDDRLKIENQILSSFGKNSTNEEREGKVVVATQVVEQSLDLDFDLVVTDLAPIELILQRAGRCQRHARRRPERFSRLRIIIFSPDPQKSCDANWYKSVFPKASFVYPFHGQLWLATKILKDKGKYTLPKDARFLIESIYSGDNEDLIPDALKKVDAKAYGEAMAESSLGNINALELDEGYRITLTNWLEDTIAPTRLGEPNVILRLAKWENGKLLPWAQKEPLQQAWALSEVNVREKMIKTPIWPTKEIQSAAKKCLSQMKDKGRWSILMPLIQQNGIWEGMAYDGNDKKVWVIYDSTVGLIVEAA